MPSPAHQKPTKGAGTSRLTAKAKATNGGGTAGSFALPVSTAPMEARSATEIPSDGAWQYEPKWDGFRCLAFKSGKEVDLRAKSGKPLGRFFPEVIALLRQLGASQFVVDGELVIEVDGRLSFDALQMRLHPAASRVQKLSQQTPARLILFDMLVDAKGVILTDKPLPIRRASLEALPPRMPLSLGSSFRPSRSTGRRPSTGSPLGKRAPPMGLSPSGAIGPTNAASARW
ncbi:ATP-dependent DNA ligase [Sinorhizobium fredii]|nr:ATP-dependent DNA ligase LigC [Sinorhizobium fredii CCBAU 25509]